MIAGDQIPEESLVDFSELLMGLLGVVWKATVGKRMLALDGHLIQSRKGLS